MSSFGIAQVLASSAKALRDSDLTEQYNSSATALQASVANYSNASEVKSPVVLDDILAALTTSGRRALVNTGGGPQIEELSDADKENGDEVDSDIDTPIKAAGESKGSLNVLTQMLSSHSSAASSKSKPQAKGAKATTARLPPAKEPSSTPSRMPPVAKVSAKPSTDPVDDTLASAGSKRAKLLMGQDSPAIYIRQSGGDVSEDFLKEAGMQMLAHKAMTEPFTTEKEVIEYLSPISNDVQKHITKFSSEVYWKIKKRGANVHSNVLDLLETQMSDVGDETDGSNGGAVVGPGFKKY